MMLISNIAAAVFLSALMLGAALLVWAPGLALSGMVPAFARVPSLRLAAVPLGSAVAGWLLFWAWFASPMIGYGASGLVAALSIAAIALKANCLTDREIRYPLTFALLICVAFFCNVSDQGNIFNGSFMVANRYWATLDNDLPKEFAEQLMKGQAAFPEWICCAGFWKYSDRPPLQTGMIMLGFPFVITRYAQLAYLMLGISANGLWIFGLWSLLRGFNIPERRIGLAIIAVSLVGAVYINTVYTWPKMLAGALTLAMITTMFTQVGTARTRSLLSGALAAFSMLAHGGAAFGIIGALIVGQRKIRAWGIKNCLLAACVAAVCYLPWVGFQKFFDPPGDRVIKMQLGGETSIVNSKADLDPRPPLSAIISGYQQAGIVGAVKNKIANVRLLVGDPIIFDDWRGWQPMWKGSIAKELRFYLDQRLGGAPGLLLIGAVAMFWYRNILKERWARTMWALVIASSIAYIALEFGTEYAATWLHTAPYSLLLLWCALGAVTLVQINRPWTYGVLVAHFVSFLLLWTINVPHAYKEFSADGVGMGMQVTKFLSAAGIVFLLSKLWGKEPLAAHGYN
jgi:hypothetical protein